MTPDLLSVVEKMAEAIEKADREMLRRACLFAKEDWKFATGMNESLEVFRTIVKKPLTLYNNWKKAQ